MTAVEDTYYEYKVMNLPNAKSPFSYQKNTKNNFQNKGKNEQLGENMKVVISYLLERKTEDLGIFYKVRSCILRSESSTSHKW
ncbi:hypothetical protein Nmel_010429 [Mimus melanotis]